MILSTKILNYNARLINLVIYFEDNRKRYGYTDLQMKTLNKLWEEWQIIYKKYIHPLTHGDLFANALEDLYVKLYPLVDSMKRRAISPLIKLSSEDKAFIDTNTNTKKSGKTPVTDYAPLLVSIEITPAFCKFFAMDPEHMSTKKKPAGADFIGIMVAYTLPDEHEPADKDFKKLPPEKKSIFDVIIKADKAKLWLYIKVYYVSPTGEEGKASKVMLVKL